MPPPVEHPIFLPKEHGSWSLAFEPIVFGLLVAPTTPAVALALSATAAFFIRRPLKSFLKHQDRASLFALIFIGLGAAAGFAEMLILSDVRALWPLLPALPLGLLYLYWDRLNENRAMAAELTGIILFALIPATMATISGQSPVIAVTLFALMLARSVPAVLTVRTWLRQRKGQLTSATFAVFSTLAFIVLVSFGLFHGYAPKVAVGLIIFSSLRLLLLSPASPDWPARRVGAIEAIFGVIYISTLATAYEM